MKRGAKTRKRGLSPIVSSVLLIMLVIVLAIMIFLWARGFIGEQIEKFDKPIEKLCEEVVFDAELTNVGSSGGEILEIVNRGNIDIYQMEIKKFDDGGNSETAKFKFNIDAGDSKPGPLPLSMTNGRRAEKIEVYPALIGNIRGRPLNKVYTCLEMGKTIQVE